MIESKCDVCGKGVHSKKEEEDGPPGNPIYAAMNQLLAKGLIVKNGQRRLARDGRCEPVFVAAKLMAKA
jgi:hypothetical protein